MDDNTILDLYWARSEQALAETAARYGAYCYAIAYNILSNREDSEECVNDTYLAAWNAIPPRRPSVLSAFLGKTTRYISLDRWKQRSRLKRGGWYFCAAIGTWTPWRTSRNGSASARAKPHPCCIERGAN